MTPGTITTTTPPRPVAPRLSDISGEGRSVITVDGVRRFCLTMLGIASLLHLVVRPSVENIACVAIAASSCALTLFLLLRRDVLLSAPISTLQVLMFSAVSQGLPIVGTIFEWKPLTYSLKLPYYTFGMIALTQATLLVTHVAYRKLGIFFFIRRGITERIFEPIGMFRRPYVVQLWAMGLAGSVAVVLVYLTGFGESEKGHTPGVAVKFIQGLVPFAYAPYLILVMSVFSMERTRLKSSDYGWLGIYFCLNLLLAIGRNSRAALLFGLVALGFALMIAMLIGQFKVRRIRWGLITACVIIAFPVASIYSDLSTAMLIARAQRGDLSASELIGESFYLFFQKEQLASYRKQLNRSEEMKAGPVDTGGLFGARRESSINLTEWGEGYTSNPLLNRFINVKFHDNIFNLTAKYSSFETTYLQNYTRGRALALFPSPVLRLFDLDGLKSSVQIGSVGDMIFYLATRVPFFSFRTGSMIGHGMAIFGVFYPLVLGGLACILFIVVDSFTRLARPKECARWGRRPPFLLISFAMILNLYLISLAFSAESMVDILALVVRDMVQLVLLYLLLFYSTRWLGDFVGRR